MAPLQFPTSSSPGAIPGEGSGRLLNSMALKDGADTRWVPVPGLARAAVTGAPTPRGSLLVSDALLIARQDALFAMNVALAITPLGVLPGSKPVTMARNNYAAVAGDPGYPYAIAAGGPHVVMVTDSGVFLATANGIVPYPPNTSGGTPIGNANSVSFLDGYLLFTYPDGKILATGTDETPRNTVDFSDQSYARAESNPDGLLRGTTQGGQYWVWGSASVEVWTDQGLSPFPLSRSQVIPIGLYGPWCIAGFEDGWSGSQIFVASDGTVRLMNGYTPQIISTRPVERDIAATASPSLLRACVYTFGGQAVWSLSGPGFTWEFNTTTQQWHERQSQGQSRWRAETSVRAFGEWFLGDIVTGNVLALDPDLRTEDGAALTARIESAPLRNFPDRMRLGGLTLDITTGQGDPAYREAMVLISWTTNGGGSWSQPLARSIGGPGRYGKPVRVGDLGRSGRDGVQVAFVISDPIRFSIRAADLPNVTARKGS